MGPINPQSHRDLFKITLKKTTRNSNSPTKKGVYDALHRLKTPPVYLSEVDSGFIARLDKAESIDSILNDVAEDGSKPLSALGLKPVAPPSFLAARTILARNLDPQLGERDADQLIAEIRT